MDENLPSSVPSSLSPPHLLLFTSFSFHPPSLLHLTTSSFSSSPSLFHPPLLQVKCYLQMSDIMEEAELQEAMEVIESTNLKYFTKEMIAEFLSLKGSFLAQTGK